MSRDQRTRTRLSHVKARLDPPEVRALLSQLCVQLGFCLPPNEIERLSALPPEDSDDFTEAVFVAEGYGVARSDSLLKQAKVLVAQAFMRHRPDSDF